MVCPEPRIRHRSGAASRGVGCSSECCEWRCTWAIGLPRSRPMPRRFRRTVVVFHRHRSAGTLRCRLHPLVSFDLLQSSFRQSSARSLARPSSSLGVRALFAASTRGVHHSPSFPSPTMFRPQRFARSRRLAPPRALRVCFAALPCPGFRFKGCILHPSRTTSSVALTLAPLAAFACRLPGASERRVDLKVVLSSRVRSVRRSYSPRRHPCPFLRFFRLPRASHRDLGRAIARPPLAALMVRCCVCPVP
jgi:hypothetical protein